VAAEYRGLTVTEMTQLRAQARGQGVYMRVVKKHAGTPGRGRHRVREHRPVLKGAAGAGLLEGRPGCGGAPGEGFAKDHDKLVATAVSLGGQLLPAKDLDGSPVCRRVHRRLPS